MFYSNEAMLVPYTLCMQEKLYSSFALSDINESRMTVEAASAYIQLYQQGTKTFQLEEVRSGEVCILPQQMLCNNQYKVWKTCGIRPLAYVWRQLKH
jgi:hypothetical protein